MPKLSFCVLLPLISLLPFILSSCSSNSYYASQPVAPVSYSGDCYDPAVFAARMPQRIATNTKTVVVDPNVHAWGAYDSQGNLVRGGIATAGGDYCPDLGRPCHTKAGVFHILSLGSEDCKSKTFPLHKGGAPMPFCMFFHGGQALHGSPGYEVQDANLSHGCVRMKVADAQWLRYEFANVGTKVVVEPY